MQQTIKKSVSYPSIDEIVPQELPGKLLTNRNKLPKSSYIYFAITEDGTIQYIGKTIKLRERWKTHHRYCELKHKGKVTIHYWKCSASKLNFYERLFIKKFNPPMNYKPDPRDVVTLCKRLVKTYTYKDPQGRFYCLWDVVTPCKRSVKASRFRVERMNWKTLTSQQRSVMLCSNPTLLDRLRAYATEHQKSTDSLYIKLRKDCENGKVTIRKEEQQFLIINTQSGQTILAL